MDDIIAETSFSQLLDCHSNKNVFNLMSPACWSYILFGVFHSFHSKTHSDCFSTQMSTGGAVSQTIYQLGERIEHRGSLIFGELSLEPPLTSPPTLQTS